MKTIYFVRHGESENNAKRFYNAIDTPLSEKGKVQAASIAERCSKLPLTLLVASDMLRAQQTAAIISEKVSVPIVTSSHFRERVTATSILGKSRLDPHVVEIVRKSEENFHDPEWRAEGGENFEDLKKRALLGLEFLAARKENTIAVVSHGFFMFIMAAAVVFGKELTSRECIHMIEGLGNLENTALTVVEYKESNREAESPWRLIVWNDHAHLG